VGVNGLEKVFSRKASGLLHAARLARLRRECTIGMSRRTSGQPRNLPLVLGLVGFTGFMCAVPILLQRRHKRITEGVALNEKDRPLSHNEVRRGVYMNSGSRDAGPDPDWDWKNQTYKGRAPAIIDDCTGLTPTGSQGMRSAPPKTK
jgi:hypothetical protein